VKSIRSGVLVAVFVVLMPSFIGNANAKSIYLPVDYFLEACASEEQTNRVFCLGYIRGVVDSKRMEMQKRGRFREDTVGSVECGQNIENANLDSLVAQTLVRLRQIRTSLLSVTDDPAELEFVTAADYIASAVKVACEEMFANSPNSPAE
jgi:hypothetical protein